VNPTEARAREHLIARGLRDVVHEPDGNIPPDFLVEGRIAVEVRQLNLRVKNGTKGVDETGWPFRQRIEGVLAEYGDSAGGTHWLNLRYRRPLAKPKLVVQGTRCFVEDVRDARISIGAVREVAPRTFLEYVHHGDGPGDMFRIGVTSDLDSGGCVVPEFRRNLELSVSEKSRKTASYRPQYPEWWLVLVDHVAYGLSARSRQEYLQMPALDHDWDRIVVVNPLNTSDFFELLGPT